MGTGREAQVLTGMVGESDSFVAGPWPWRAADFHNDRGHTNVIALVRQCLRFRELLATFVSRELKARYRGSVLGSFWMILQPLLFLCIYYAVFSSFMKASMPSEVLDRRTGWFALSMFCGLIPWISFVDMISRGAGCVLENGNLIKKFAFPSELLPAYLALVALVNSIVGFGVLSVAVLILHGELPHHVWLLPIALILQATFSLGLTYLFASSTVFIRDIGHMLPMLLNFWFFLTPIFFFGRFPLDQEILGTIFRWNPMTYLIEIYRSIFVYHPGDFEVLLSTLPPEARNRIALLPSASSGVPWEYVGIFAAIAFSVLFIGYRAFMSLKPRFADEV